MILFTKDCSLQAASEEVARPRWAACVVTQPFHKGRPACITEKLLSRSADVRRVSFGEEPQAPCVHLLGHLPRKGPATTGRQRGLPWTGGPLRLTGPPGNIPKEGALRG